MRKPIAFMRKTLLGALLSLLTFLPASVQAAKVDPVFGDTIDRTADDFVTVSLCIADPTDWREDALGTSGHAFLRLQCPVFGLDFCFSYEGERVNDNLLRYLSGNTKMGMFAVPTSEYLQDYRRWNRSVHEYLLAMPADADIRLWEIMDNHLTKGITLTQDLNKYGCAITAVKYVKKSLGQVPIVYAPDEFLDKSTRREIGYRSLENHPWLRLTGMILTDSRYDRECPIDEKLIIPADVAEVWQKATVNGKQFATYAGDLVSGAPLDNSKPWLTPMLVAVLMLILTLFFAFTRLPYWDWCMLSLQAILGLAIVVLWFIVSSFSLSAYLVMILLNPLPAIFWKWRRYWGIAYSAVLLAGVVVLALLPHALVDPALLVLALSYVILFAKDPIKSCICNRKKRQA